MARIIANGTAQGVTAVATALLVTQVFDRLILNQQGTGTLLAFWFATALVASGLMRAALRKLERVDAERLGQSYVHELRTRLFRHLLRVPYRALQQKSRGGLLLRFVGDLTALRQWVSLGLARLAVAGVTTFVAMAALAFVDLYLAMTVTTILGIGALASLYLGRSMARAVRDARSQRARLSANVTEKLGTVSVIQAFVTEQRERRLVRRQSQRLAKRMIQRARVAGQLRAITEATTALASAGALLVGAAEVAAGMATPGTVVGAMVIVGLLVPPLRDLGRLHEYWHGAQVSRDKIRQLARNLRVAAVPGRGDKLEGMPLTIELEQVSLDTQLQDVSVRIDPGSHIVVVGANGAGKSTLLALFAQLLRPDSGRVLINGKDAGELDPAAVRSKIGFVSHDLPLIKGSVEQNIRYASPELSDQEYEELVELVDLQPVLDDLPDGLGTRLTESAQNISLGQRLRIALARALATRPDVLLLDEVDANLDPAARLLIDRVFEQYPGTVIMVSHHTDHLDKADTVWCLDNGRLVESGTPTELLAADGPTSRLLNPVLRAVG
jgi:ABC-type multidrug transport system fused ATPase/permease subunit